MSKFSNTVEPGPFEPANRDDEGFAVWPVITKQQHDRLKRVSCYANRYRAECEEARYSDTDELWNIIQMFDGVAASIVDANKGPKNG